MNAKHNELLNLLVVGKETKALCSGDFIHLLYMDFNAVAQAFVPHPGHSCE